MANFSTAASKSVEAVVHVKSLKKDIVYEYDPFQELFGFHFGRPFQPREREQVRQSSGSGVIISPDGYVVTNNHVIEDADALEVILNDNRSYKAEVIGKDPSTDLALLKLDAENLHSLQLANSDDIIVGQWVLAVGNPFNLSSTVTAGIISAKARNLNLLKGEAVIESFIQTDAAVNPGNSGGALVNMEGELIGINTAIATPTGAFAGYSFAIPSNIVSKVMGDLMQYGIVQRAFIGADLSNLNNEISEKLGLGFTDGVLIKNILNNGAADKAGLKENDVVIAINDTRVSRAPQLMEKIAGYRPGNKVSLVIIRKNEELKIPVILQNEYGKTEIISKDVNHLLNTIGAKFSDLSPKELKGYGIQGGVKVSKINSGLIQQQTNMQQGFVVLKINNKPVKSKNDLLDILMNSNGGVMMEGFYPGYYGRFYYAIGL